MLLIVTMRRRKHTLNQNAFSVLTPEAAYWIGFIMADGNVWRDHLTVRLSKLDLDHIKKFQVFLDSSHKVTIAPPHAIGKYTSSPAAVFSVSCRQLVADLLPYGVVERKSLIAEVKIVDQDRDFWRGYFDGNGTLVWNPEAKTGNKHACSLATGSRVLAGQFAKFVASSLNCDEPPIRSARKTTYIVHLSGDRAHRLTNLLYQPDDTALTRKANIAQLVPVDAPSVSRRKMAHDKLHPKVG